MRKGLRLLTLPLLVAILLLPGIVKAQAQNPMLQPLPVDSAVRIGKLPNGLTYYIRHNEYPKGQADFYIAQNVGSILENDEQSGLAHFLEHMCFNGTTNFPGSSLRDWLETVGVKFGANLNAYTDVDETVYNISNVPVARESVQDSCLLILHDWANDLTLDPQEIDKERGVIHEEWRKDNVGQRRILNNILPDIYPTSKYAHRMPIGSIDVIDNFPYQAIRDYYETWYRPDQQAIVVVGDIDVDRIENKIKEMFSDIEMPANAPERKYEPVPDHKGTLYGIGSDPEQQTLMAQMMFLSDVMPKEMKNTQAYYIQSYIESMIASMLDTRLNEISSKPDAPFAGAAVMFGGYMLSRKTKDAMSAVVIAHGNDIVDPMKALYREILRAQRGGFTESEYERARNEYLSSFEKAYNNRATRENGSYVNEYVKNFTDGEPIPGIEVEWPMMQQLAMMIPVQAINQVFAQAVTPYNRVVVVFSPETKDITVPTQEIIANGFTAVDAEDIPAFVDEVKSEPLIPTEPTPGTIVSTTENGKWGTTEWTLSNGAKVIVKPTKFKEDEIFMQAYARGGYADYPEDYTNTILTLPISMSNMGLGSYTNSDLSKYTAGKQVSVTAGFNPYSRIVAGQSTPKDLNTFMELLYMTFKDIEFTADEFEALQKNYSGFLANQEKSPEYLFEKFKDQALYASPFKGAPTSESILGASREQTIKLAHDMTDNAADFTFIFVGNVTPETLKPLVEKYIASLPGDAATAVKAVKEFNPGFFVKKGEGTDTFTTPMTTPQTFVSINETGGGDFTMKNSQLNSVAAQILTNRLIKTVREEMGAVYSISASGSPSAVGPDVFSISSRFPMKPEMKDEVLAFIKNEIKGMETNVTEAELNPIKEYMVKAYAENSERNLFWMNGILTEVVTGVDTLHGNSESMNSITVDDVKNFMKSLNAQDNYRIVVLDPKKD